MAAERGRVEVVKLLVEVASLTVQDESGGGPQLQSIPVDLWPWRFVLGLTWWQPEFRMQRRCFHHFLCVFSLI